MRGLFLAACSLTSVAMCSSGAMAWHFETRFVERIGNVDVPMADDVQFEAGSTHRMRMQFGVFDDANGPAPIGGFAGWGNGSGTLSTSGGGTWSRTPGRLSPFAFAPQPNANGFPLADPFTSLTNIDNTIGLQSIPWGCDGAGQPLPPPPPVVRGLNSFVSTYEVSVLTPDFVSTMNVAWGGFRAAVAEWRFAPEFSQPPDCETGTPGVANYFPLVTPIPADSFTQSLRIQVVPSPGAGVLVLAFGCGALIRRRVPASSRHHF